jgi:hypothetical protein
LDIWTNGDGFPNRRSEFQSEVGLISHDLRRQNSRDGYASTVIVLSVALRWPDLQVKVRQECTKTPSFQRLISDSQSASGHHEILSPL